MSVGLLTNHNRQAFWDFAAAIAVASFPWSTDHGWWYTVLCALYAIWYIKMAVKRTRLAEQGSDEIIDVWEFVFSRMMVWLGVVGLVLMVVAPT